MKDLISSQEVSGLVCLPSQCEPDICYDAGHEGILIGVTERLRLPFMLHPEDLVNPHILICGMTGGGKTFLARSIASRAYAECDFNLLIIDFTSIANLKELPDDAREAISPTPLQPRPAVSCPAVPSRKVY